MKKLALALSFVLLAATALAIAAEQGKPELRPSQKLMQAYAAWRGAMEKNLAEKNFDIVAKNAMELAAQSKKAGEGHPNPLGKELHLAISTLSGEISAAAAKQDGDTVKAKIGEIKAKCGECHAKIRDKK
jgi:cytochrome c556